MRILGRSRLHTLKQRPLPSPLQHHHSLLLKPPVKEGANDTMTDGYKSRCGPAAPRPSFSRPYQKPQDRETIQSTTKHQQASNKSTYISIQASSSSRQSTSSRHKMTKCYYCGNDSSTYSCGCASEYASTSSFDRKPTSLSDPKPEFGSGSSSYTGLPQSTYASTQSTEYVGKRYGLFDYKSKK